MRHPWSYFMISPTHPYEMIVYRNPKADFYFFGNTVAFSLGFPQPHTAVHTLVDAQYKHSVPFGSGVFLDERGVRQLAQHSADPQPTLTWLQHYIPACRRDPQLPKCPH